MELPLTAGAGNPDNPDLKIEVLERWPDITVNNGWQRLRHLQAPCLESEAIAENRADSIK